MYKPMTIKYSTTSNLKYWPPTPSLLNGGLNLVDKEYKLPENQTSKVKNLWFHNGELGRRFGQDSISNIGYSTMSATHKQLYNGKIIVHMGDALIELDPTL